MTSKEKRAQFVSSYVHLFRCPICKNALKVVNFRSLICSKKHTFDFAKQGYVNMLTRPVTSQYDKQLFESRKYIITESDLYFSLHKMIAKVMNEQFHDFKDDLIVLDAGSGEGSHLQRILDESKQNEVIGVGIDISKDGIKMAAAQYKNSIWFVGDLANAPFVDQSCHVILNILSPANYEEFKRILAPNGIVVKVVPRSWYLKQLREAFYDKDKTSYENDKTVSLFKQHFHLVNKLELCYTKELDETEVKNLAQMTPLTWNVTKEEVERVLSDKGLSEIMIDLDILIGKKI